MVGYFPRSAFWVKRKVSQVSRWIHIDHRRQQVLHASFLDPTGEVMQVVAIHAIINQVFIRIHDHVPSVEPVSTDYILSPEIPAPCFSIGLSRDEYVHIWLAQQKFPCPVLRTVIDNGESGNADRSIVVKEWNYLRVFVPDD